MHPFNIWTSDLDVLAEIKPDGKVMAVDPACSASADRSSQNENIITVTVADARVEAASTLGSAMILLEMNAAFRKVSSFSHLT